MQYSNTYALYCRGWRGINVEPRRGVLEEFKNYRPRDTSLDLCVCPSAQSTVEFYCFVDPFLSTADPSRADKLVREGHALLDARQVPAVSLAELFTRYVPHNTAIDLLSIDVEGWDEQILRSNDWQRFKPRIVLFEQLGLRLKEIQRAPIVDFLESLGYEFVAKCGESVIMKHELTKDDSTANGQ